MTVASHRLSDAQGEIRADEFARLMARCGPFEPRPLLAAAVSGGADSMALALLAREWARARSGHVVALTVDHGLRAESRVEARSVARWMRQRGIEHRILRWQGAKPGTGVQAAARSARYRMLADWCRAAGVVHLLLGHNRDDQAETVLLRLAAGSGPLGLAAMAPVRETAAVRLLRPLLGVARTRLAATLRARDQSWIEDPSNRDDRFERIRVRRMLAGTPGGGAHAAAIAGAAAELGRHRAGQERLIAESLARAVEVFPEGYARLDAAALAAAAPEIGWRALSALLAMIGGLDYPPRGAVVRRLFSDLVAGRHGAGRSVAHCRLITSGAGCLVVREMRGIEKVRFGPGAGGKTIWDGRFDLAPVRRTRGLEVGALGAAGWAEAVVRNPRLRNTPVSYPARLAVPALRDRRGLVAVPALGFGPPGRKKAAIAAFRPRRTLAPAFFAAQSPA